jgi:hypothetical protein
MKKKLNNFYQKLKNENYINKFEIKTYFPDKTLSKFINNFK